MKKDLLGIGDLTRDDIHLILDTAEAMREVGAVPSYNSSDGAPGLNERASAVLV